MAEKETASPPLEVITKTTISEKAPVEEKAASIGAAASSIAGIATTIASLALPQYAALVAGFATLLKYAPTLYLDFMLLLSKGEPTQEQKDDFNKKLSELMNPEDAYKDPPA